MYTKYVYQCKTCKHRNVLRARIDRISTTVVTTDTVQQCWHCRCERVQDFRFAEVAKYHKP